MKQCKTDMQRIAVLIGCWVCALASSAQDVDSVLMHVFGGPQDDRGARITLLEGGDLLLTGTTNSTTASENHAWILRVDSNAQTIWSTTVEDDPLLQAVDAIEHSNGSLTILGMRYANPADGYDWGWYHLSSEGGLTGTTTWGSSSWDLPVRCWNRNDTMWTLGTSYATGNGDIRWMQHGEGNEAWSNVNSGEIHATAVEEIAVDGVWTGDTLVVASTLVSAANRARVDAFKPGTDELLWTYESSWEEPTEAVAMDASDSGVLLLMNVVTADGDRLAFAHFALDGTLLLENIPGSGFDIQGRSIHWYSPTDFATVAWTEQLGLGGEEVLFSRWSSNGGFWQGGPSFGSPWDDAVNHMEQDASGRLWFLGRTDGYSNGRDDFYLLGLPDADVGGYVFDEEIFVGDSALTIPDAMRTQPLRIAPNPARQWAEVIGWNAQDAWMLVDFSGRSVRTGMGFQVSVEGLPPGTYYWIGEASGTAKSMRAIPIQVIR
jgi:hypothetical protein